MMFGRWSGCFRGFWGGTPTMGYFAPLLNWVVGAAVGIGLILLVVWMVRSLAEGAGTERGGRVQPERVDGPLEILHSRYAQGEISREEYLEMKADLS